MPGSREFLQKNREDRLPPTDWAEPPDAGAVDGAHSSFYTVPWLPRQSWHLQWHRAGDFRAATIASVFRGTSAVSTAVLGRGLPPNIDLHGPIERDAVLAPVVELRGAGGGMGCHWRASPACRRSPARP